ncbi:hypothetical protein, partial [Nocardia farcinica]
PPTTGSVEPARQHDEENTMHKHPTRTDTSTGSAAGGNADGGVLALLMGLIQSMSTGSGASSGLG